LLMNFTLFSQMCGLVQLQCSEATFALIVKLDFSFPNQEFMSVFGCGLSALVACYKSWNIIPLHLEVIISFYWWIFHWISWSLNCKLFLKQPWSTTQLKSWKKIERSATIWSTCGCLYQHFGYSFNPSLSMWSLPNLPCAKFWHSLRLNIVSTLCFSWRANFVTI